MSIIACVHENMLLMPDKYQILSLQRHLYGCAVARHRLAHSCIHNFWHVDTLVSAYMRNTAGCVNQAVNAVDVP